MAHDACRDNCRIPDVDRLSELMVVKLSSWPDDVMPEFTRMTHAAIDAIRDVLIGSSPFRT